MTTETIPDERIITLIKYRHDINAWIAGNARGELFNITPLQLDSGPVEVKYAIIARGNHDHINVPIEAEPLYHAFEDPILPATPAPQPERVDINKWAIDGGAFFLRLGYSKTRKQWILVE